MLRGAISVHHMTKATQSLIRHLFSIRIRMEFMILLNRQTVSCKGFSLSETRIKESTG